MTEYEIKEKISKIVWECKWSNHIKSWYQFATLLTHSVEGDIVSFSHETIRKMANQKDGIPDYSKWRVLYDHSSVEWIRNLAKDIMGVLRPELWRENNG